MDTGVEGVALLTIFVLSAFTGYEVISKVSTVLHTPLLSGANAIHGVILIGAILVAGTAEGGLELAIALLAVTLATVNLVGGFVVTDRMLQMFGRGRPALAGGGGSGSGGLGRSAGGAPKRPAKPGTKKPAKNSGKPTSPASSGGTAAGPPNSAQRSESRTQPPAANRPAPSSQSNPTQRTGQQGDGNQQRDDNQYGQQVADQRGDNRQGDDQHG